MASLSQDLPRNVTDEPINIPNPILNSKGTLVVKFLEQTNGVTIWGVAFKPFASIWHTIVSHVEKEMSLDNFKDTLSNDPFFIGMSDAYAEWLSKQQ